MLPMQRQMRLVTIPLLLTFAAVLGYTQTPSAPPPAKHKTKVETKFDAHKNETELRIGPLELWKPPQNQGSGDINFEKVEMFVAFSFPGKKIVTPATVNLVVASYSQWGPQLEKRPNISISIDSVVHDLGNVELIAFDRSRVITRGAPPYTQDILTTEVVKKAIPFDGFGQIAQSQKAEIKLGDRKFKFTDEHLEAFRSFVILMKQQGMQF
jgi:hypothetical protein